MLGDLIDELWDLVDELLLACLVLLVVFVCGGIGVVFWVMAWSLGWADGFMPGVIGSIFVFAALNLLRD